MPTDSKAVLARLEKMGSKTVRDGMARFGLPSDNALGISIGRLKAEAKKLGKDHALALALWKTGVYEARVLATFIDDPAQVTSAQMEAWCKDFDSWGLVDTACFALFARSPLAWPKVALWAKRKKEFEKRAAFALLASLVMKDKKATTAQFAKGLLLIEKAATDERNFVKKAVNWALRCIGKHGPVMNKAAIATAKKLAARDDATARWIGKDALRDLASPASQRRLARQVARG